jgi:diguanylate cyclase (GGDEF)-like protein
LLVYTIKLEEQIEQKIFDISTSDLFTVTQNNAHQIHALLKNDRDFVQSIKKDPLLQHHIETHLLRTLLTANIKYAYLLYKDDRGIFRFISDASSNEDKALFGQKFDVDSPEWFSIYTLKQPLIIHHTLLHQLSLSYLVPIVEQGEVRLILAIDFSIQKIEEINQIIAVMKKGILGVIFVIFGIGLFALLQAIRLRDVRKSAFIDTLTNVYNRNYLQQYEDFINLEDYIIAALDIDFFKKINDTYGHDAGDRVLAQIADTILLSTRNKDDIVIRYGGEEFLILARARRNDHLQALNVIERVFNRIQESRFSISASETIQVTVSIGVNIVPYKSRTFLEAFKLADIALYNAKTRGRNTIEIYDESDSKTSNQLSLNDIKEAIDENRITCYYQKIVSALTKDVSHYEALLRIIDTQGNIVTPDRILPSVKGTFILRNITKKVLAICFEQLRLNPDIRINVNLNPQDIIDDAIVSILKTYANEPAIATRLGLEIIETEDLAQKADAKENLCMLKHLGYKIFIDDFGSGYSNFIYLAEIKPDFIKIDGTIIQKILHDTVSFLLVKNIVSFAKEANIQVVAEYVSDDLICAQLQALEIGYLQGFLFAYPEPMMLP